MLPAGSCLRTCCTTAEGDHPLSPVLHLQVVAIGLGSRANGQRFSEALDFPLWLLYAGKPAALLRCALILSRAGLQKIVCSGCSLHRRLDCSFGRDMLCCPPQIQQALATRLLAFRLALRPL